MRISIFSYFFKLDFGIDSYNYWKIGFNSNNWIFTDGRINGLQAGGPNAFGGIIACLGLYCIPNLKGSLKDVIIFISLLGCFLTYSRAALIVFVSLLFIYVFLNKMSDRINSNEENMSTINQYLDQLCGHKNLNKNLLLEQISE